MRTSYRLSDASSTCACRRVCSVRLESPWPPLCSGCGIELWAAGLAVVVSGSREHFRLCPGGILGILPIPIDAAPKPSANGSGQEPGSRRRDRERLRTGRLCVSTIRLITIDNSGYRNRWSGSLKLRKPGGIGVMATGGKPKCELSPLLAFVGQDQHSGEMRLEPRDPAKGNDLVHGAWFLEKMSGAGSTMATFSQLSSARAWRFQFQRVASRDCRRSAGSARDVRQPPTARSGRPPRETTAATRPQSRGRGRAPPRRCWPSHPTGGCRVRCDARTGRVASINAPPEDRYRRRFADLRPRLPVSRSNSSVPKPKAWRPPATTRIARAEPTPPCHARKRTTPCLAGRKLQDALSMPGGEKPISDLVFHSRYPERFLRQLLLRSTRMPRRRPSAFSPPPRQQKGDSFRQNASFGMLVPGAVECRAKDLLRMGGRACRIPDGHVPAGGFRSSASAKGSNRNQRFLRRLPAAMLPRRPGREAPQPLVGYLRKGARTC